MCLLAFSNPHNQNDQWKQENEKKIPIFANPKKMFKLLVKPAGKTAIFGCKSFGNPSPNITWYKNAQPLKRSFAAIRYQRWKIILEDLNSDDSGNYTCEVCNEIGCINFTYSLDVLGKFSSFITIFSFA